MEENPSYAPFLAKIPRPTAQQYRDGIARLFRHAASVGCTGLHDVGSGSAYGVADVEDLEAVMKTDPPIRDRAFLVSTLMDKWIEAGFTPNMGNDPLRRQESNYGPTVPTRD
jgi:hypothetical protein